MFLYILYNPIIFIIENKEIFFDASYFDKKTKKFKNFTIVVLWQGAQTTSYICFVRDLLLIFRIFLISKNFGNFTV